MRAARWALALCLFATPALAGDAKLTKEQIDQAMPHSVKAVELYTESDFAGALVEFKRAHEIAPDWHVLFNIAQCQFQLQNYAAALDTFQHYLSEGGKSIPKDRKEYVDKEIAKLKGRVAQVEIIVNVPGADIFVDEEKIGTSPLTASVTVSQGKRKIVATMTGHTSAVKNIEVAGGDTQKIELELAEDKTTPPDKPPAVVPMHKPIPFWAWGVTGGLFAFATGFSIGAVVIAGDANSMLTQYPGDPGAIQSARDTASTLAVTADVFWALTIAALATSIVLTVTAKPRPTETKAQFFVGPTFAYGTF